MPNYTKKQNAIWQMYFPGKYLPGFEPELSEKATALQSLMRRGEITPSERDSVLAGLKKIAGVRTPSAEEEAIERGVLTGLWPRAKADSMLAGAERVEPSLLTPQQQRQEALIKAKLIPGAKTPVSPYGKPPWWMSPESLKTESGKAYARKQIEGIGKSPEDLILTWQTIQEKARGVLGNAEDPLTQDNPELFKIATARIDALSKELTPKRPLIDKRWGGLKHKRPEAIDLKTFRLKPTGKKKPSWRDYDY